MVRSRLGKVGVCGVTSVAVSAERKRVPVAMIGMNVIFF
jgi:hypothetical protein